MGTQLKNHSDEDLIHLYKTKKSAEVFGIIYERYAHLVYGVCLKYLKNADNAKDAMMQIFEKLFIDLHKHEIQVFKAWIYRVSQNHCFMVLRSNNHLVKSVEFFPDHSVEYEDTLHPKLEKEKMYDKMEMAIDDLTAEQKNCILLFYIEKKTYQEIMTETGLSFMQVKSNIQNGKRNLKIKMTENNIHE
ncbi:MAG: sigma-70 family RNA polymerase sigma factor [Bacteroidetes bacterium]|nr:sigma-70 family RNA polymerase sigma factor [Bacteroidota bacterium]MBK8145381.1 sigma-70 family RNA polymerase sigma factor [Bacteroidota bacterium]MBP6316152.1 sigma-70 family RNA polymerase sigma factor [Chitinophagaceae bacterium]